MFELLIIVMKQLKEVNSSFTKMGIYDKIKACSGQIKQAKGILHNIQYLVSQFKYR